MSAEKINDTEDTKEPEITWKPLGFKNIQKWQGSGRYSTSPKERSTVTMKFHLCKEEEAEFESDAIQWEIRSDFIMDRILRSMKQNEISKFKFRDETDLAVFGIIQAGGCIAIHLLHWIDYDDISHNKDKTLLKQKRVEGKGWEKPTNNHTVTVEIIFPENGEAKQYTFAIGKQETFFAIDHTVKTMKVGELAHVEALPSQIFDGAGNSEPSSGPLVDPGNSLNFEIKLLQLKKCVKPISSIASLIKNSTDLKIQGNEFMKDRKFEAARTQYEKAVKDLYYILDNEEARKLNTECLMNLGLITIKEKKYKEAEKILKSILEKDPNHIKCLYRQSKFFSDQRKYKKAIIVLQKAISLLEKEETPDQLLLDEMGKELKRLGILHSKIKFQRSKLFNTMVQ